MLAHLIQHKGKGMLVFGLPLILSAVFATLADAFSFGGNYIGGASLLLSGCILFWFDTRRKTVIEGDVVQKVVKQPIIKNRNTLMWIEMRYWAILSMIIGMVWLFTA